MTLCEENLVILKLDRYESVTDKRSLLLSASFPYETNGMVVKRCIRHAPMLWTVVDSASQTSFRGVWGLLLV